MFKTYIADGREYFLCGDIKKDFPFPESLLRFLYLDIMQFDPLVKRMAKSIEAYCPTRDEKYLDEVAAGLDELAASHIYFEFLRDDWQRKLDAARIWKEGDGYLADVLPRKELTQIVSLVYQAQQQIKALFAAVLDKGGNTESMAEYYSSAQRLTYEFRPLTVNYELTDEGVFADVLYPSSIYDLTDFSLRECVKRGVPMRVCKNCGRYFALTGKVSAEYCDITTFENGRTCKDVGAMRVYTKNKNDNETFKEYRREYKRRFARMKSGRIDPAAFYAWSAEARQKEAECESGKISFEEFKAWLKRE